MTTIAVIMFYTTNLQIGNYTEKINRHYCKKNNYDFYCFNEIPDILKNIGIILFLKI